MIDEREVRAMTARLQTALSRYSSRQPQPSVAAIGPTYPHRTLRSRTGPPVTGRALPGRRVLIESKVLSPDKVPFLDANVDNDDEYETPGSSS